MSNLPSINLPIRERDGEPRVLDIDLASRLEFSRPADIRKLIARHRDTLEKFGPLFATVAKTAGRPASEVYLTEQQAVFITTQSDTAKARDVTVDVVNAFVAWRHEKYSAKPPVTQFPVPQTMGEALRLAADLSDENAALKQQAAEAAPKVSFYDQFANTEGLFGLQNAGRALGMGPNKFIALLKQGYLFYQGKNLIPRACYRDRGLFEVKITVQDEKSRPQTFVTPKGMKYFAKKFDAPESGVA